MKRFYSSFLFIFFSLFFNFVTQQNRRSDRTSTTMSAVTEQYKILLLCQSTLAICKFNFKNHLSLIDEKRSGETF